jgi:hypothetical protein
MEMSGQLDAPAASPQGNSPRYPLDRRLGGPQSLSGRGGEERRISLLLPPGIEPQSVSMVFETLSQPILVKTGGGGVFVFSARLPVPPYSINCKFP